ncbi:MAG: FAD-dependent monooxygenase [Alphaproteobacteria bacterium]|nr:FAD-dependent monooxygenase [Alphaproteobacteria bacterium]
MKDIVIIGGGMAGAAAAAVYGRSYDVTLIDPHEYYPPVFAADKIAGDQLRILMSLGLFDALAAASTPSTRVINAQHGHIIERKVIDEYGIRYQTQVETVRALIPTRVERVVGHATDLELGEEKQRIRLSNGSDVEARLIVLATGFSDVLRAKAGIKRKLLKANHSLSFGFDIASPDGKYAFPSLTYYGDRISDAVDYINMFWIGDIMRANLFVYREPDDKWVREFRTDPQASVYGVMPGLRRFLPSFAVTGPIQVRTVDLYTVEDHIRPGIVLIGDASQTPCPALGMGLSHTLTDVARLETYLAGWLSTPGMSAEKIGQFYADPVKNNVDAIAMHGAHYRRATSTQAGWRWDLHRGQVYWRRRLRGFVQRVNPFDPANAAPVAAS